MKVEKRKWIPLFLFIAFVASTSGIPMNVCQNYKYMYNQCLPPHNWMCDKPMDYTPLDLAGLSGQLRKSSEEYIHYIQSCAECIGDPAPYLEKMTYKKTPVCREVKVPVEYVNKTVYHEITGQFLGHEVCQVVLNNQERNIQKVYRTECYNGDRRKNDHYCRFDYGTFKEYFCRPTNYVYRTMLVYCPSSGLQYYKEKVSTACSCVRVKCVNGFDSMIPIMS